jgi:zinc transport system substrate-binding protein
MKIRKLTIIIIIMAFSLIALSGCEKPAAAKEDEKITVAVSIVPQEAFVNAVAGDLVEVVTMIPPGSSPESYQPVPQQMVGLSEASLYFTIGVPTEKANIIPKLKDMNPDMKVVFSEDIVSKFYDYRLLEEHHHEEDLDEDNHEVEEEHEGSHDHDEEIDPHIWLSPRRVIVMVETIRDELILLDGENKNIYVDNAQNYINALRQLDKEIMDTFDDLNQRAFIIYHPAYGYFADDYGLAMVTIEEKGKPATVSRLQYVIDFAREKGIKVIFYQDEFDNTQAKTIAKEIEGTAISVSPLSYDYIGSMRDIIEKLSEVLK